ncbi:MAG: type III pantothenate kinase [Coriobacteriales bacterium]|nr:type III pantothenate kinase [Coriobacteriales bacterium]
MILAVDVGNTQTVLGLIEGGELAGHWRIHTNTDLTDDELRVKVDGLLALDGRELGDVDRVIVSSVVPSLTESWTTLAQAATGRAPMLVGPGLKTGIAIRYDNPAEVGADRIVNAVAAVRDLGAPVIVVDFGTATTVDVVDAAGTYIGGMIAPGLETSADALFSKAARLAKVDLEAPPKAIGTNTRASIQAGLILGAAAQVDGLVRKAWDELGGSTPVVATGGLAPRMAPFCETVTAVDPDLTLKGLLLIHELNS